MLEKINNLLETPNIALLIVKANIKHLRVLGQEIQEQPTLPYVLKNTYMDAPKENQILFGQKLVIFCSFGREIWILHDEDFTEPYYKTYCTC